MRVLALVLASFLVACTGLTKADEARMSELITAATQRVLTEVEALELERLREKASEGGFDWGRLVEAIGLLLGGGVIAHKTAQRATNKTLEESNHGTV